MMKFYSVKEWTLFGGPQRSVFGGSVSSVLQKLKFLADGLHIKFDVLAVLPIKIAASVFGTSVRSNGRSGNPGGAHEDIGFPTPIHRPAHTL